ncbi:MAG: hypothetical protein R2867_14815 [Caldilineaceae bacterium]
MKQTIDNSHGKRWNGILVRGVDEEANFWPHQNRLSLENRCLSLLF